MKNQNDTGIAAIVANADRQEAVDDLRVGVAGEHEAAADAIDVADRCKTPRDAVQSGECRHQCAFVQRVQQLTVALVVHHLEAIERAEGVAHDTLVF